MDWNISYLDVFSVDSGIGISISISVHISVSVGTGTGASIDIGIGISDGVGIEHEPDELEMGLEKRQRAAGRELMDTMQRWIRGGVEKEWSRDGGR